MVTGVKKDTGSVIYMRLQKHKCPICDHVLKVKKMTRVVKASTKAAKDFDFNVCGLPLGEKVKFIWYEFRCSACGKQYTEADMKAHEKKLKREARFAKRAEKKAAKQAPQSPEAE